MGEDTWKPWMVPACAELLAARSQLDVHATGKLSDGGSRAVSGVDVYAPDGFDAGFLSKVEVYCKCPS